MRFALFTVFWAFLLTGGPVQASQILSFDVFRGGSQIGTHRVEIRELGDRREVDIAIDLEVRFAFLTVYRYTHRARETWQADRLIALTSATNDNGEKTEVSAQAIAHGLAISGSGGSYTAPPDTLPTSYWNRDKLARTQLLDTQTGKLIKVKNVTLEPAISEVDGQTMSLTRYRVTGDLNATLGYAPDGSWAALSFEARGAKIDYIRRSLMPQVSQGHAR